MYKLTNFDRSPNRSLTSYIYIREDPKVSTTHPRQSKIIRRTTALETAQKTYCHNIEYSYHTWRVIIILVRTINSSTQELECLKKFGFYKDIDKLRLYEEANNYYILPSQTRERSLIFPRPSRLNSYYTQNPWGRRSPLQNHIAQD